MVKAFDAKGNISAGSDSLAVSTLSDSQSPSVPVSPSVSDLTFTSAKLEWGPSTDNVEIKGYEIFRDGVKKAVTGGTSYICKGLSSGRSYTFSIRSLDTAGNYSPFANINISTKTDAAVPTTPNGLKAATVTGTEATLTWIASTDNVRVKGYEIFNEGKKVGSSVKTVWKYKKLAPGKPTTFTVRAVDTSGLVSAQSTPYTITAPSNKASPTVPGNLRLKSSGSATAGLSWNASTDNIKVAGYRLYCNGSVIADTTKTSKSVKISKGLSLSIYWVRAYDQSENLSDKSNSVTIASYK
jgi:chitodextrinase